MDAMGPHVGTHRFRALPTRFCRVLGFHTTLRMDFAVTDACDPSCFYRVRVLGNARISSLDHRRRSADVFRQRDLDHIHHILFHGSCRGMVVGENTEEEEPDGLRIHLGSSRHDMARSILLVADHIVLPITSSTSRRIRSIPKSVFGRCVEVSATIHRVREPRD